MSNTQIYTKLNHNDIEDQLDNNRNHNDVEDQLDNNRNHNDIEDQLDNNRNHNDVEDQLQYCKECIMFFSKICLLLTTILNIGFIAILVYIVYPLINKDIHSNINTILIIIPIFSIFCVCSFMITCMCTRCINIEELE